jgi:hypothetical protein
MRLLAIRPILVVSSLLLAVPACSGSTDQPTGTTSGTSTGSGSGTGGTGGTPFDAGAPFTTYTASIGPITLGAGVEQTNCIVIHLGNMVGGFVRRFRADLSEGSHHMIVYQSLDTVESPTPTPCQALSGILTGEHPVFIAQQANSDLLFPSDESGTPVGFQIDPDQMVKIEFHTINTTSAPLEVTGKALIDTVPLSTKVTVSDLAFWGTTKILIPANGSYDTGVQYQAAIPGTKSFAVTTHQHHLGTEMQVWYGTGATDLSDRVADGKDWSNPPLVMLNPVLDFPADGSKGLAYECHWVNPTAKAVFFGEGFNNEMCFLWHYYYPSQGFQYCVDSKCK